MVKAEGDNRPAFIKDVPAENFAQGILEVDLPTEFGPRIQGKVRENWVKDGKRIIVTTDRTSAFDKLICTIRLKGFVLNITSAEWFVQTKDIIPNHMIYAETNFMIARQAAKVIPVEVVLREYMAKSSTSTSIYHNYAELGKRNIYGIDFPEGLRANERFPMGPILTPTTKADKGHDLELDEDSAREIADKTGGFGTWDKIKVASARLFERGSTVLRESGLILVDTKYEFGIDENGELMLIDELHTSDSSRIWKADSYEEHFEKEEAPQSFDKEILRRWLSEHGYKGEGDVPVVDKEIIDQMVNAYRTPFEMLFRRGLIGSQSADETRESIVNYFLNN